MRCVVTIGLAMSVLAPASVWMLATASERQEPVVEVLGDDLIRTDLTAAVVTETIFRVLIETHRQGSQMPLGGSCISPDALVEQVVEQEIRHWGSNPPHLPRGEALTRIVQRSRTPDGREWRVETIAGQDLPTQVLIDAEASTSPAGLTSRIAVALRDYSTNGSGF